MRLTRERAKESVLLCAVWGILRRRIFIGDDDAAYAKKWVQWRQPNGDARFRAFYGVRKSAGLE
jgi:hypothetical protein